MKKNIILILKGIIIGFGKILPGVSGGVLAISLGVYEKGVNAINYFWKDIKKNFTFLTYLGIGMLISIIGVSKIILVLLNNHYFLIMLLFIGLIIGGIPSIYKTTKNDFTLKNSIILVIPILIVMIINFTHQGVKLIDENNPNFFLLMLLGVIESITMIIPGLSGTAILMLLGSYEMIINAFSNLTNLSEFFYSMEIVLPFFIGLAIGIIILIKIISYLLNKHRIKAYYGILGFSISSVLMLLMKLNYNVSVKEILTGIILFFIGIVIGYKLDVENS